MSDSVVIQLQRLSLDENCNISELLRKAYFVARKLKISDVKEFLIKEINGYGEDEIIAPFRIIKGNIIANDGKQTIEINLSTNHLAEYNFCRAPVHVLEEIYKSHSNSEFLYTKISDKKVVSKIESQLVDEQNKLYSQLGLPISMLKIEAFEQMRPQYKILLKINRLSYKHILSTIRLFISEWSIQLEEQGYTDENFQFSKEVEMSINNNYNINTANSIIGDINNSTIYQSNTSNFKENDVLLRESLNQKLVPEEDIEEISKILKQIAPPKDKDNFPPQVTEWLKKMVAKSLEGSWEISVATAGSVLSQILCLYFGIM
ncbi:AbiTii domain-containing protein [Pantoea agglomerans]|uniref:AbiTii domain-containing protein n=1 Tax=Enterobacter agglomerans TaxID=549 RepID=UPI002166833F|nr:hypothetical protein [Pantoea agglomerans]UVV75375.1 hypothetical protein NYF24_21965 [Pantoea agglomerans]